MEIFQARIWSGLPCPPPGIFPTQGLNPDLPHCRQVIYQLSHQGRSEILEWVGYSFSRGMSWSRNWTRVSCISGGLFTSWATREALVLTQLCPNRHFCEWFLYSDLIMTSTFYLPSVSLLINQMFILKCSKIIGHICLKTEHIGSKTGSCNVDLIYH